MNDVPDEWIDKLFKCFDLFYGFRWSARFTTSSDRVAFYQYEWKNGLKGLSKEEIRTALAICKQEAARDPLIKPPHVVEFYRYAKGGLPKWSEPSSTEVARRALDDMKKQIKKNCYS